MMEPQLLTEHEVAVWLIRQRWTFAKTMPKSPHWYTLKRNQDSEMFERVVATIWHNGYQRHYKGGYWRSYDVGDRRYIWVCTGWKEGAPAPLAETVLVNGTNKEQTELDI